MSSRSSSDRRFIQFNERLHILKFQHAVAFSGHHLLYLVLEILICGDINNIIGCLKDTLGSNTKFKKYFKTSEIHLLEKGDHRSWDISLIFKVIQKACGLHPVDNKCWTQHTEEDEPLEYLITTIKDWRNEMAHNFNLVISAGEMKKRLNSHKELAAKLISALKVRAKVQGKQLSAKESKETNKLVLDIIKDAESNINESTKEKVYENVPAQRFPPGAVPEESESDDESDGDEEDDYESDSLVSDSVNIAAVAGGNISREQLAEEEYLTQQFWKYIGHGDDDDDSDD